MKYTENNIIGLKVKHKDGESKYEIIRIENGQLSTINQNGNVSDNWCDLEKVNNWIKGGIWIVESQESIYQVY